MGFVKAFPQLGFLLELFELFLFVNIEDILVYIVDLTVVSVLQVWHLGRCFVGSLSDLDCLVRVFGLHLVLVVRLQFQEART